jgi:hypothetical protein
MGEFLIKLVIMTFLVGLGWWAWECRAEIRAWLRTWRL